MVEIRKIIDGFKHAFEANGEKFTGSDIVLIKKLADFVVRRNMSVPAVMFLESVRPLNFVGSQSWFFLNRSFHVFSPEMSMTN